jgi:hypothetical protein
MLAEPQIEDVWKSQLAVETRALYFADRYTRQKKWITALSFFLSSAAAATLVARLPSWVPLVLSLTTAVITSYSVAFGLDSKMRSMARLHSQNSQLATDYERLWNNVHSDDAVSTLNALTRRDHEISASAELDAPNNEKIMARWQDYILRQHGLPAA